MRLFPVISARSTYPRTDLREGWISESATKPAAYGAASALQTSRSESATDGLSQFAACVR
jgi:hypothetical protein